ncbi:MAG TPA: bifunctional diguanylate cyclase/phosphodiesterase [Acidimicrobiales bacterium]|jgi:diguanylate cyclase (GGDEF)-like protein
MATTRPAARRLRRGPRTDPVASLAALGRRAQAGGELHELAAQAAATAATLFDVPCALVLGLHANVLVPLAAVGWPGPVSASLVDPDQPERGVTVSQAEAAGTGVAPASQLVAGLTVRGRLRGVIAIHGPRGRTADPEGGHQLAVIAHILAAAWETRLAHEDLEHLILHDPLTGLPNRAHLVDRLDHAIRRRRPERMLLAVASVDIDRLVIVNDSYGYAVGDRLLADVGARLRAASGPDDLVARYDGDKFVVLCTRLRNQAAVRERAEALRQAASGSFRIDGREIIISASAGVAIASGDSTSDDMLGDADLALDHAKQLRSGRVELYRRPFREHRLRRHGLESDLRRALRDEEFAVHYQPVVRLEDGVMMTTEALVRWAHPERGLIPPVEFIPLAEESSLILDLGEWVLNQACRQARRWADLAAEAGTPALGVAVNLSARQVSEPGLLQRVRAALKASALHPNQLTLEITESAVMADAENAVAVLEGLKNLGVDLSIDDFGTGYSSLSYLKRFPVDTLKIDRSFVAGLGDDPDDAIIVGAIIRLSDVLGIETLAEGVETPDQVAELLRLGCVRGQGYFFARPQPAEEITARLGS